MMMKGNKLKELKINLGAENKIGINKKYHCTGCGVCTNICPQNCIQMETDKEGFLYPYIDKNKCLDCGLCRKICPESYDDQRDIERVYGMYCKNSKVRDRSSSGGIFPVLAERTIRNGGIVFGVKMNREKAVHCWIDSIEDLPLLQGSKYVQSNPEDAYKKARDFLEEGIEVLFTGTPCQIAALYSFLNKRYENLITMDFICHGVSSPKVLELYLKEIIGEDSLKEIQFRNKSNGWKEFSIYIKSSNNIYLKSMKEDPYLQSFLQNLNIRPSCFFCRFRKVHRISDFTMGDLWENEKIVPEWNDDKGYSVVLVHNRKAEKILETIKEAFCYKDINLNKVIEYNSSLLNSPWDLYSRDLFFKYIKKYSLTKACLLSKKDGIRKKVGRKWKKLHYIIGERIKG